MTAFHEFVALNRRVCRAIDQWLPRGCSMDGNQCFITETIPKYARREMHVVDVGGGKTPCISEKSKRALQLRVVGLDVSHDELVRAPSSAYDDAVVGDICQSPLAMDADLVVCMTVIEHVTSANCALAEMARLVRPGGVVAVFVPCRNALFARLNLVLPERLKRRLLGALYPETSETIGFRAYYDACTPSALEQCARDAGFQIVETQVYNWSGYFDFFVPFYVGWRVCSLLAVAVFGRDAADRFSMIVRRPE